MRALLVAVALAACSTSPPGSPAVDLGATDTADLRSMVDLADAATACSPTGGRCGPLDGGGFLGCCGGPLACVQPGVCIVLPDLGGLDR